MSRLLQDIPNVSFFGRPYQELLKCFGLDESELIGKSVLECPSGPSSFVAEATKRGLRAIGVDPLFYRNPSAIRALALADFESMFERVRRNCDRFVRRTYRSVDEAEASRRAGLERFLADYAVGHVAGRYQVGALPRLGFEDRAFDTVLCAHFLFIYSDQFDLAFHRDAIVELCRLASSEVRIHPIVDGSNQRYLHLDELTELAESLGFRSRIQEVDHEFFKGTNETLVLRRVA